MLLWAHSFYLHRPLCSSSGALSVRPSNGNFGLLLAYAVFRVKFRPSCDSDIISWLFRLYSDINIGTCHPRSLMYLWHAALAITLYLNMLCTASWSLLSPWLSSGKSRVTEVFLLTPCSLEMAGRCGKKPVSTKKFILAAPDAVIIGHKCTFEGWIPYEAKVQKIQDWPEYNSFTCLWLSQYVWSTSHLYLEFCCHYLSTCQPDSEGCSLQMEQAPAGRDATSQGWNHKVPCTLPVRLWEWTESYPGYWYFHNRGWIYSVPGGW